MRRQGNLTERIASLDNLYEAFRRASRGKQRKKEVREYVAHLDEHISLLRHQILSGSVDVGHYHYFTIYEPKERIICAASFAERVLHHALMNVCHEYFDRSLISSTCATRPGKGLYTAARLAVQAVTRFSYTAKLDVRKYFDSIDHGIIMGMLERKFKDETLLVIFHDIIDSYSTKAGKGLPIGNLTSQYMANMYLSGLDHYAKQELGLPVYIRYMDDMFIAANEKQEVLGGVRAIVRYAEERLNLTMKPPVCQKSSCGQVFLGYRVLSHHMVLSGKSKRRFRSRLLHADRMFSEGRWDQTDYQDHIVPLLAFTRHAAARRFRKSCMELR